MNVVILLLIHQYDIRLGPVRLAAHGLFKPIQLFVGAFIVCLCALPRGQSAHPQGPFSKLGTPRRTLAMILLALIIYGPFIYVNFQNPDWNHGDISAQLTSLPAFQHLFTRPQVDGFYRPLTFISLWIDYKLAGSFLPAYHFQNIIVHLINSFLVYRIGLLLGLFPEVSAAGGALFAVAPAAFEPVLWPAARFDLLATMFSLVALAISVSAVRGAHFRRHVLIACVMYCAALLNKESAYCLPLLFGCLIASQCAVRFGRVERRRAWIVGASLCGSTVIMLLIRVYIYGNLGGYTDTVGRSPHFHIGMKTAESLLTRVLAIGPFTLNLSTGSSMEVTTAILLYLASVVGLAITSGRPGRLELSLAACSLITALPTANIIGWLGESAQFSRYLYLPGVWLALLLANLIYRSRRPLPLLLGMSAAFALGTWCNLDIYRRMLDRTVELAGLIETNIGEKPVHSISIEDLPPEPMAFCSFATSSFANLGQGFLMRSSQWGLR